MVKQSPYFRAHSSMNGIGRVSQRKSCTGAGAVGPGGREGDNCGEESTREADDINEGSFHLARYSTENLAPAHFFLE
jgi:hypothetical protein